MKLLKYRIVENSLNWLVKCTVKYLVNSLITHQIYYFFNEIVDIQDATHNAVILFHKLTGRFVF
jgi:hypothetical protein